MASITVHFDSLTYQAIIEGCYAVDYYNHAINFMVMNGDYNTCNVCYVVGLTKTRHVHTQNCNSFIDSAYSYTQ